MTESSTSPREVLAVLRTAHDDLTALLSGLSAEQASGPSYDDDWSIADVASHLGSGAEIFRSALRAGVDGSDWQLGDGAQPIWDAWNAKPPEQQVADCVTSVAAFLDDADALSDEQQAAWRLELFGAERDLASVLLMRLSEHVVHGWDVAVALDPTATLLPAAVPLLLGQLPMFAGMAGKPRETPLSVEVRTAEPARALHLDVGPAGVALAPSYDDTDAASLDLPGEALVRLVYGRLDPDHTPASVVPHGTALDALRAVFPGF